MSIRLSNRSPASLAWELDLLATLAAQRFWVPEVVATDDGRDHADGVVVQRWLGGRPPASGDDWRRVAAELARLHRVTVGHRQRPGCCRVDELERRRRSVDADLDQVPSNVERRVVAVFASIPEAPVAVVHGDPGPGNIRIDDHRSRIGLLDWDESRVDVTWHDLSNLGVAVLDPTEHRLARRLSDAWEAVNAWLVEPRYAADRLASLDDGS